MLIFLLQLLKPLIVLLLQESDMCVVKLTYPQPEDIQPAKSSALCSPGTCNNPDPLAERCWYEGAKSCGSQMRRWTEGFLSQYACVLWESSYDQCGPKRPTKILKKWFLFYITFINIKKRHGLLLIFHPPIVNTSNVVQLKSVFVTDCFNNFVLRINDK